MGNELSNGRSGARGDVDTRKELHFPPASVDGGLVEHFRTKARVTPEKVALGDDYTVVVRSGKKTRVEGPIVNIVQKCDRPGDGCEKKTISEEVSSHMQAFMEWVNADEVMVAETEADVVVKGFLASHTISLGNVVPLLEGDPEGSELTDLLPDELALFVLKGILTNLTSWLVFTAGIRNRRLVALAQDRVFQFSYDTSSALLLNGKSHRVVHVKKLYGGSLFGEPLSVDPNEDDPLQKRERLWKDTDAQLRERIGELRTVLAESRAILEKFNDSMRTAMRVLADQVMFQLLHDVLVEKVAKQKAFTEQWLSDVFDATMQELEADVDDVVFTRTSGPSLDMFIREMVLGMNFIEDRLAEFAGFNVEAGRNVSDMFERKDLERRKLVGGDESAVSIRGIRRKRDRVFLSHPYAHIGKLVADSADLDLALGVVEAHAGLGVAFETKLFLTLLNSVVGDERVDMFSDAMPFGLMGSARPATSFVHSLRLVSEDHRVEDIMPAPWIASLLFGKVRHGVFQVARMGTGWTAKWIRVIITDLQKALTPRKRSFLVDELRASFGDLRQRFSNLRVLDILPDVKLLPNEFALLSFLPLFGATHIEELNLGFSVFSKAKKLDSWTRSFLKQNEGVLALKTLRFDYIPDNVKQRFKAKRKVQFFSFEGLGDLLMAAPGLRRLWLRGTPGKIRSSTYGLIDFRDGINDLPSLVRADMGAWRTKELAVGKWQHVPFARLDVNTRSQLPKIVKAMEMLEMLQVQGLFANLQEMVLDWEWFSFFSAFVNGSGDDFLAVHSLHLGRGMDTSYDGKSTSSVGLARGYRDELRSWSRLQNLRSLSIHVGTTGSDRGILVAVGINFFDDLADLLEQLPPDQLTSLWIGMNLLPVASLAGKVAQIQPRLRALQELTLETSLVSDAVFQGLILADPGMPHLRKLIIASRSSSEAPQMSMLAARTTFNRITMASFKMFFSGERDALEHFGMGKTHLLYPEEDVDELFEHVKTLMRLGKLKNLSFIKPWFFKNVSIINRDIFIIREKRKPTLFEFFEQEQRIHKKRARL